MTIRRSKDGKKLIQTFGVFGRLGKIEYDIKNEEDYLILKKILERENRKMSIILIGVFIGIGILLLYF